MFQHINSPPLVVKVEEFKELRDEIKKYKEGEKERSRVTLKEEKEDKKVAETEEEEEPDVNKDQSLTLDGDPILQESLRVTVDYVRLLAKKGPAKMSLPGLKKDKKSIAKAKKAKPVKGKK